MANEQAPPRLRILLVEDDASDADLLARHLRRSSLASANLTVVTDLQEGRQRVARGEADLVLLDLGLPDAQGLEGLRVLHDEVPWVPIVVLTGREEAGRALAALDAGAEDYLKKAQLEPEMLARSLRHAFERSRLREALRESECRRRQEEQLGQVRKMEAIGRLAGGVAHDFNNLMTVIISYAEMLLERLPEGSVERYQVEQMHRAGRNASALTDQLLAISRRQVLEPRVIDLNEVVTDQNQMLRRLIGEHVELVTLLDPDLGPVHADPAQMQQVILNLAVNARDAMPKGGKLIIETADVELDAEASMGKWDIQPGLYAILSVSDTGAGMDQATLSRIFEPFFTTKAQGKGTGLGLSTVYGIVKQSGGHTFVYSEPGQGASFKIYLPRVEGKPTPVHHADAPATLPRGKETVLLVEDRDELREVAASILERNGYTVLTAPDGAAGLELAAGTRQPIQLVITDVVMPRMSGPDLATRLVKSHPETRVLFLSSYADSAIVHHGALDPGISFLHKPFTPASLVRKVRETLDS